MLLQPDGTARLVDGDGAPPLGSGLIDADVARGASTTVALEAGSAVLFYTDGLVERRSEGLDDGLARLLAATSGAPASDPEALCQHVLKALVHDAADDVVVLALGVR